MLAAVACARNMVGDVILTGRVRLAACARVACGKRSREWDMEGMSVNNFEAGGGSCHGERGPLECAQRVWLRSAGRSKAPGRRRTDHIVGLAGR